MVDEIVIYSYGFVVKKIKKQLKTKNRVRKLKLKIMRNACRENRNSQKH